MNCIYKYTNKINGHMYIGLAKNADKRFHDHLLASRNINNPEYNYPIHKAIRKYGIENFLFEIIEDNLIDEKAMKQREIFWIKYYNTYEDRNHYNQTPGGDLPGYNTAHLGEDHGMSKLTTEDVIFCRKSYQEGKRSKDIYNQYFIDKINWGGFERMRHGQTWKHIMPEVFKTNPHRAKYGEKDRDIILELYKKSNLSIKKFSTTKECYVGYGTLWNMINNPSFYEGK